MKIKPFGLWHSPVTAETLTKSAVRLGEMFLEKNNTYWLEGRPLEKGRTTLMMKNNDNKFIEITPKEYNIRTRAHEYGGGACTIHNDVIYFVNYSDGRIYKQRRGDTPEPITPKHNCYYADLSINNNKLIAVQEDHNDTTVEPINSIIIINLHDNSMSTFASGHDFYMSPRFSADGSQISYICWDHPSMPWDNSYLYLSKIDKQNNECTKLLIEGGDNISVSENRWAKDGTLYFISDVTGYGNIYQYKNNTKTNIYKQKNDFGTPAWVFGLSSYTIISENKIICTYKKDGENKLAEIDIKNNLLTRLKNNYCSIQYLTGKDNQIIFLAGEVDTFSKIISLDLTNQNSTIIKQSVAENIDKKYLSKPKHITFPTAKNEIAYAFYYPPTNNDYSAADGDLPPVIVKSHGGPTSSTTNSLSLKIQYWTSRGFAIADVNYRGSTGYGRQFQDKLNDNWGIADIEDCAGCANYLIEQGLADKNRIAISGGSAGGFTTLAALTFTDTFHAGASYYGISDLEILAKDTHKFESRYLDNLIGRYPEEIDVYHNRSPLYHSKKLSCPVIFFQGLQDKVVPPNQAEAMVSALKKQGIYCEYHTYPDEQHGFRMAETIKDSLEKEYQFYLKVFEIT